MRRIKQLLTMHFGAGASTRAIGRELGSADFAKRANGQGSKIEALIEPQVPKGALAGPDQSEGAPQVWGRLVLDSIDPNLSKACFKTLFQKLEGSSLEMRSTGPT